MNQSDVIFLDAPQGTAEWHRNRVGHATASRFRDILNSKQTRESYLWEVVAGRFIDAARNGSGQATRHGHEQEPEARRIYQARTGNLVREVGFAVLQRPKWVGCSSDGLIDDDGCQEIKSPFNHGVHAETLVRGMPPEHFEQVQGGLWILRRSWCDFTSFDPAFMAPDNLYVKRVERDEKFIQHLEVEVKKFLAEVNIAVRDIKATHNK
jgi:hypothetical protein